MLDSTADVSCPICSKEMRKYFLKEADLNVDVCLDGCGCLYFDNQEFKKIKNNELESNKLVELLSQKSFEKATPNGLVQCPNCGRKMVSHYTTPSKRNAINECYYCGGILIERDIFLKICEELKLPKDKQEKIEDYIQDLVSDEVKRDLLKESSNPGLNLKDLFIKLTK